jgi:hypothetical protein
MNYIEIITTFLIPIIVLPIIIAFIALGLFTITSMVRITINITKKGVWYWPVAYLFLFFSTSSLVGLISLIRYILKIK